MVGLILVVTGLSVAHRLVTDDGIGLIVVCAVAVAAVLGALLSRASSPALASTLALSALPAVAAAFALAVPGDFGAAQILLAAAGSPPGR